MSQSDSYNILCRSRQLINTDPQRRCYNGCHASSELVWNEWEVLDHEPTLEKSEARLKFWTELNDFAVGLRGGSAKSEFKIQEVPEELI